MLSAKRFFTHLRILCVLCFSLVTLNSFAGGCPQATITVQIFTDNFPDETSWEIRNANTNALIASDDLSGLLTGTLYFWEVCVPHNTCFTFTIFDDFGDGICCGFGNGFYNILVNGTQVATGGSFANSQLVNNICTPPQSSGSCTVSCNGGAAPVNDDCFGSINLGALIAPNSCTSTTNPGQGTVQNFNGSNLCANAEFPYTYIAGCQTGGDMAAPAADVWYRFSAVGSVLDVQITGNMAGVSVGLYQDGGSGCGNLLPRGCAENPFGGNLNALFTTLSPGTYYLQVSGRDTLDECTFNIRLVNNNDCTACIIGHNMTATPPPSNGRYRSGTTVRFCYTVDNYNQTAVNWLHGIVPVFGSGWNMSTLTAFAVPPSCDGNGSWSWRTAPVTGTSPFAITSVGPGFFYESNQGCPTFGCNTSNPGDNYGDNNPTNLCDWTFCWTITTKASCPPGSQGEDLSIEIFNYGDSETGSWNQSGCTTDPNYQFFANLFCCDTFMLAVNNVRCFGGTDGSCTVQGGGQSPWDYELRNLQGTTIGIQNNDSNSHTFTGLAAGDYIMVVTDDNFCSDTRQFRIGQPDSIGISGLVANVSCSGAGNGSITVTVAGGVSPYSFLWSPGGQTTQNLTGLSAGTYTVTVTDGSQCSNSRSFTVTEPQPLAGIILVNDASCFGGNSGSANVVVSGGTIPYNYLWDRGTPVGNGSAVTNLTAGTVSVIITDNNGCIRTLIGLIGEPQPLPLTTVSVSICQGDSVFAGGGFQTAPGVYYDTLASSAGCDSIVETTLNVFNAFLTQVAVNICDGDSVLAGGAFQTQAGVYQDIYSASTGCDSIVETTLGILPSIFISTSIEICNGESVFVGGDFQTVAGFYYDTIFLVSGCDSIIETELIVLQAFVTNLSVEICDGESYYVGGDNQTTSGIYYDTVTLVSGCDSIVITELTVNLNPQVAFITTAVCLGQPSGLTNLSTGVDAGAIYYVDFLSDGSFEIVAPAFLFPTDTFVVIPFPGVFPFTVIVVNSTGCSDTLNSFVVINNVPQLAFTYEPSCAGGTATVTNTSTGVDAGATYYFDIDNDGTIDITAPASSLPVDSSFVLTGSGSLTLRVIVVNSTGCSDTLVATFDTPENPVLSFTYEPSCAGGTATVTNTSTGVDAGATYYFDINNDGTIDITAPASSLPVDSSFVLTGSGSLTLRVIVVNSTGCSDTLIATFDTPESPALSFTYEPSCVGGTATVTNTSSGVDAGATYYFDINNDGTIDITTPASTLPVDSSFVLTGSGSLTLRVIVLNSTGCSDTLVATFDTPEAPALSFTYEPSCVGGTATVTNTSSGVDAGATYYFDINNDGTIDITAPASSLPVDSSFVLTGSGSLTLRVIVVNSTGCSDTLVATFDTPESPALSFTYEPSCVGGTATVTNTSNGVDAGATYYFDINNDGTIDITAPASSLPVDSSFVLTGAGSVTLRIIVVNSTGCSDTLIATFDTPETPVLAFTADTVCLGQPTNLSNLSTGVDARAIYYLDFFNDGTIDIIAPASIFPSGDTTLIFPVPGENIFKAWVVNSTGCSDTLISYIVIKSSVSETNVQVEICPGESVFAGGDFQTDAGFYSDTYIAANGCDSVVTTEVILLQLSFGNAQVSICDGDSYIVGGGNQTQAGFYVDTLTGSNGCDSILTTELIVLPNFGTTQSFDVCDGDGVVAGGAFQTTSGTYFDTLTAANGCDSVVTTNLNVGAPLVVDFDVQHVSCGCVTTGTPPVNNNCALNFTGLPHGTILNNYFAALGVSISATANGNHPNKLVVFNSNLTGTPDPDLQVGIGNIAIIPDNIVDNNNDGLVDIPNDNSLGGVITFEFDDPRTLYSFVFVDNDRNGGTVKAYDASNTLIATVSTPSIGGGSVQTVTLNIPGVKKFTVSYNDSRGITDIRFSCPPTGCELNLNSFAHGTIMLNQLAAQGITITGNSNQSAVNPDTVAIFNSNVTNSMDPDLQVGIGNLLILPTNLTDVNGDGLIDNPNDASVGGQINFNFDRDRTVYSITLVDNDRNNGTIKAYGANNNLLLSVNTPSGAGSSIQVYNLNVSGVRRLEISYRDSRGVTGLVLDCAPQICCDGNATASATGGFPPYQYTWSTGSSDPFAGDSLCVGTYYVTITDQLGCIAVDSVTVIQADVTIQEVEICAGDSVLAGGAYQTETGTYYDTTGITNGCPSILVTELMVHSMLSTTVQVDICEGQNYFAGGALQTTSGTYVDVFIAAGGCDSTVTTELTVNPAGTINVTVEICQGDSALINGNFETEAGAYADSMTTPEGCVNIVITELIVHPAYSVTFQSEICSGDSLFVGGAFQTTSGTYTDVLASTEGCDSTVTTELTVTTILMETVAVSICDGESFLAGGALQTTSGTYLDTFTSSGGCDSIVTTELSVNPVYSVNLEVQICAGDSFFVGGAFQKVSGSYTDVSQTSLGCDSSTVTDLIVVPSFVTNEQVTICEGESYFAGGALQTQSGTYADIFTASGGCDSTVITELTVNPSSGEDIAIEICEGDSIFAGGIYQTQSGIYVDIFTASNGCDSVLTTTLTVLDLSVSNIQADICEGESYFAGGALQTESGTYVDILTAANGCDSVITTTLTVLVPLTTNVHVDICEGESYLAGGALQTQSGVYFDTLISANGCDSIIITDLAVSPQMSLSTDVIEVSCFGGSDGQIDLTVSGGTAPYTFNWSDNQTTEDILGLAVGAKTVTVTDAIGCSASATASVTQPQPLALGATTVPASCTGESDGSIDLLVLGGSAPYTYLWSTTETTQDISGLPADQFSVQVTDNNGCVANVIVIVAEPDAIVLTATVTNESAGNDGAIDLTVNGGTSPYSYNWSNGNSNEDIGNLTAGDYIVTVTDDNRCTVVDTFTVAFLPPRLSKKPKAFSGNIGEQSVETYPVPFIDFLIIEHNSDTEGEIMARVRDILGRIVKEERLAVQKGKNRHTLKMDANLLNGIYMLELETSDQNKTIKAIMK